MITGISISLIIKTQTGVDAFNRPIYEETTEAVSDVLVGQPTSQEVTDTLNLTGRKAVYTLGIPKGDAHAWDNVEVVLPAPFAGRYRSIGLAVSGIEDNVPLRWNTKVMVERCE